MSNKKEIRQDLDIMNSLDAVKHTEGGKILIKRSLETITNTVDSLASNYISLSHAELMGLCARLSERLAIYRALSNTDINIKLTEEALEEALKEDPDM